MKNPYKLYEKSKALVNLTKSDEFGDLRQFLEIEFFVLYHLKSNQIRFISVNMAHKKQ